jgi:aryl-alcohol dehydrogenase-like predicted oxidoreductase
MLKTRRIGDREVGEIGLGAMPMSIEDRPSEEQAIATIHAALDAGVTLIDSADAYHLHAGEQGHNELLLAKALSSWGGDTSTVLVCTKGGHTRAGDGGWGLDGRPEYLKEAAKASLKRLGGDAIGLYFFHRPDPRIPFEDSLGALVELVNEGIIQTAGVSNVGVDRIRVSQQILGDKLVAVQNQFSPAHRGTESDLDYCARQGIAFMPWSPLSGIAAAPQFPSRYQAFTAVGVAHGVSAYAVCLAWELAKAPVVIPIPGSKRTESILDCLHAAEVTLSPEELLTLDSA